MEFIQSYSGPIGAIDGYCQLIPGTNINSKTFNIICADKSHLKYDCFIGNIVNRIREPVL